MSQTTAQGNQCLSFIFYEVFKLCLKNLVIRDDAETQDLPTLWKVEVEQIYKSYIKILNIIFSFDRTNVCHVEKLAGKDFSDRDQKHNLHFIELISCEITKENPKGLVLCILNQRSGKVIFHHVSDMKRIENRK